MEAFERRLEVLAAQLVPDMEQLALNPTAAAAAAAVPADSPFGEPGSYAVVLPEVLDGEGSWDVYRCGSPALHPGSTPAAQVGEPSRPKPRAAPRRRRARAPLLAACPSTHTYACAPQGGRIAAPAGVDVPAAQRRHQDAPRQLGGCRLAVPKRERERGGGSREQPQHRPTMGQARQASAI
jgi:hypothetical protein